MPKLRNGNNGVRTRALSIASPAFYQLSYRAPHVAHGGKQCHYVGLRGLRGMCQASASRSGSGRLYAAD